MEPGSLFKLKQYCEKSWVSMALYCLRCGIQKVSHNMSHMCQRLRRLWYYINEYSPDGNHCRKSKVWYDMYPKIPRLDEIAPGNWKR